MANELKDAGIMSGEIIKDMQLQTDQKKKLDPAYGLNFAQYLEKTLSGTTSYYWLRNQRFGLNRRWASGRIDIRSMFQDRMNFNGKENYANLSWKAIMIINTIITKEVAKWMGRAEKIVATATDPLSVNAKKKDYQEAEFALRNKQQLQQLQQASGVPMTPQDQFQAESKEDLDLWAAHLQRLPEEILYEEGINDVFSAAGFFDTVKEKLLHGSSECGLVGTYVEMDDNGVIRPEWIKEENIIYSYSEYDDLRDTTWRGRVKSLKISELRRKYGKEFGGKLTEEEIWAIAQTAKEYQMGDKIMWIYEWTVAFLRPYDEWNVDVIEAEIRSLDANPTTVVTTKKNKATIVKKGKPQAPSDNEEYIEDKYWNIYRIVYVRYAVKVLEWGLKKNMITPQDPKKMGDADFSYSFYLYQNLDMRNIAIPEKIEEPAEMLILTRLKMQQVIAKMRPTGAAINIDAVQELDYGLGEESNRAIDPMKQYDQTGNIYYRGRDAEGNPIPVPIQELQNSGFLGQMQGLIAQYQFQYKVLVDELGQNPDLIAQATRPRVAEGNVQASIQESDNSSSHIYDAYLYVMEETARKVSCLLKDSVHYGAAAYRHILNEEDAGNRVFNIKLQMLPSNDEIQVLMAQMNQALQSNPDLIMYLDTFKLMRMAKENVKLAEVYFRQSMKKMREAQMQMQQQNQQANIQGQSQAAQDKAAGDQQTEVVKGSLLLKNTALAGLFAVYAKGPLPPELMPLSKALMTDVAMMVQSDLQAQQPQQQAQQGQMPQQGPPPNQAPPPDQSQTQMPNQGQAA